MQLIDQLTVRHGTSPHMTAAQGEQRTIELYLGDLTALRPDEGVDFLVVSAFPDDYLPVPHTLIGSLAAKGVSVAELAAHKDADLRQQFSCWLSRELITRPPGIEFRRLLCFEPNYRGAAPEVVGDIFRSLAPFLGMDGRAASVAMPLVATGQQRWPVEAVLPPLMQAAVHWMSIGLPLQRLKLVTYRAEQRDQLARLFAVEKQKYSNFAVPAAHRYDFDLFVSYAHKDSEPASFVLQELKSVQPSLRVFFDRMVLNPGVAWQQEIYEALDNCRFVMPLFSPAYVASKMCKEEFNIAVARQRESESRVVYPLLVYSADLPTYMKQMQFVDCREANRNTLRSACEQFVAAM